MSGVFLCLTHPISKLCPTCVLQKNAVSCTCELLKTKNAIFSHSGGVPHKKMSQKILQNGEAPCRFFHGPGFSFSIGVQPGPHEDRLVFAAQQLSRGDHMAQGRDLGFASVEHVAKRWGKGGGNEETMIFSG